MTVIEYPEQQVHFYMDGWLHDSLERSKKNLKRDDDRVILIDGAERAGKSVLAMQIAKKVDPTFNLSRVCFNADEFVSAVSDAEKYHAVIFDEAFRGLSSRSSLSQLNRVVISKMMEMGQKNLFIIIVLPTFFMLDKYVAIFRSSSLFHVYKKGSDRGFWLFFDDKSKKRLYLNGKKDLIYSGKWIPMANRSGRFYEQYVIDENGYREKKRKALEDSDREGSGVARTNKYIRQRNVLFAILHDRYSLTSKEITELCFDYGFKLDDSAVRTGIRSVKP